MSELPQGWAVTSVGDLIELNPKNQSNDDVVVGFVPMPLMATNFLEQVRYEEKAWRDVKKGYTHFANGDVLLAKITPCFENGKAGIASDLPNGIGAGSTEYFVCRPKEGVLDAKYLLAFFKTRDFLIEGEVNMTGSVGHKRVPKDYLLEREIPLAPLAEQKRIADKLDALLARVDATRERLDRIPTLLKRFRQSVLAAATSGQLTEDWRAEQLTKPSVQAVVPVHHGIGTDQPPPKGQVETNVVAWADVGSPTSPESTPHSASQAQPNHPWHELFMRDVLDSLKYGTSKKCDYEPVGRPVLRIPNIGNGFICRDDLKYAEFDEKEEKSLALEKGDLLLIRSNGSLDLVGKVAIVSERETGFLYAGYLIRLRVAQDLVLPEFAFLWLSSPRVRDYIELTARSTSGVNNLNSEEIGEIRIAVPLRKEQEEIVRRVDALFALADKVEAKYTAARAQVNKLTPALFAKAFRGELVPQDPNDEPAAKLLERIRTTREPVPAELKKGRRPRQTREAV